MSWPRKASLSPKGTLLLRSRQTAKIRWGLSNATVGAPAEQMYRVSDLYPCLQDKTFYNPMTATSEKCIACFPKIELGLQPQCFANCIGKIRFAGWISKPEQARPENPIDFLVH